MVKKHTTLSQAMPAPETQPTPTDQPQFDEHKQKIVEQTPSDIQKQENNSEAIYDDVKTQVVTNHHEIINYITQLTIYTYTVGLMMQLYNTDLVQKIKQQITALSFVQRVLDIVQPYTTSIETYINKAIELHYTIISSVIFYALSTRAKINQIITQIKTFSIVQTMTEYYVAARKMVTDYLENLKTRIGVAIQPLLDAIQPYVEKYQVKQIFDKFVTFLLEIKSLIINILQRGKQIAKPTLDKPVDTQEMKKMTNEVFRPRFVNETLADYTRQQVQLAGKTAYSAAKRLINRSNPPVETVS